MDIVKFFPCFIAGAFIFTSKRVPTIHWSVFAVLLLLLTPYAYVMLIGGIFPQWLVCLAVAFSIPHFCEIKSPALARTFSTIAKYSYGIYLFHWMMMRAVIHISNNVVIFALLSGALTALASVIAFHLVETPFINFGKRIASYRFTKLVDPLHVEA
jgi:peptidoglycan/LPS O-acetylase OafA/YrhL